jgi:hypothetical protein
MPGGTVAVVLHLLLLLSQIPIDDVENGIDAVFLTVGVTGGTTIRTVRCTGIRVV